MRYPIAPALVFLVLLFAGCKKNGQDDSKNSNGGNGGPVCNLTTNTIQTPEGIFPIGIDTAYLSPNATWYTQWLVNDTVGVGVDFGMSTEPLAGEHMVTSDFGQLKLGNNRVFIQIFIGSKTYVAQEGTLDLSLSGITEFCQLNCKNQSGDIHRFSLKTTLK
ncbi:MAG: hypothetical protein JNM44_07610 [Chitinophagaceae bacterium]|nr:hypothetical protein [Chitinophagaceae bacterium]